MNKTANKLNILLKWFCLIVIIGSFPVIFRFGIYLYPNHIAEFQPFSLTDLSFYGISLHTSSIYEISSRKKDCIWNTLTVIFSILLLIAYIICSTMSIIESTETHSFSAMAFLIPASVFLATLSYGYNIWGENNE